MMRTTAQPEGRSKEVKRMVTTLVTGDTIHVGDSVTLTLLGIEDDRIRIGVELSKSASPDPSVLVEERKESDLNWWDLN